MVLKNAVVICIGSELLSGRTVNTNATWIGEQLNRLGLNLKYVLTIDDQAQDIVDSLTFALQNAELILITGGLGPTKDDITRQTIANYFDAQLYQDPKILAKLNQYYVARGRVLNPIAAQMALVPHGFEAIESDEGAAPALRFTDPTGRIIVALPGVPYEMKHLFEKAVIPFIKDKIETVVAIQHFRTCGTVESALTKLLHNYEVNLPPHIQLAYNASIQSLDLRLTLKCSKSDYDVQKAEYDRLIHELRDVLKPWTYTENENVTLQTAVLKLLAEKKATLSIAESCTGGTVSAKIVSVPGASNHFLGSVVAYSNDLKIKLLQVKPATLADHGAVSEATAAEMAEGIRKQTGSSIGFATTGIAGPDGGSDAKPVGTVCFALSDAQQTVTWQFLFEKNRERNIERASIAALRLLWNHLVNL